MKKIILCLFIVVFATACTKEETIGTDKLEGMKLRLNAGTEVADPSNETVRAAYNGTKYVWEAGDVVGATFEQPDMLTGNGNENVQFTQVDGTLLPDGTKVQYEGTLGTQISGNVEVTAYYPYDAGAMVRQKSVSMTFPATQQYVPGGYKRHPVFATYTGDLNNVLLQFKNPFSIIKLTLQKDPLLSGPVNLRQIVFKSNNNESISGTMIAYLANPVPSIAFPDNSRSITLDCGEGVELTTSPQSFYIVVPPMNYMKGYSFAFITDQGMFSKSAHNAGVIYDPNKIYVAPTLTIDALGVPVTIPDINLRAYLQGLGLISIVDASLGKVTVTAAGLLVTSLDLTGKNITSMAGLENFPLLQSLNCSNNAQLASLDLSDVARPEA